MPFKYAMGLFQMIFCQRFSVKFQKKGHEEIEIILCVLFTKMLLI